jgi:DNA transformation protein
MERREVMGEEQMVSVQDWGGALTSLPNVGAILAAKLRAAGVTTTRQLMEIGSVEAALRIRAQANCADEAPCASMLSALEGAIRGIRWHGIPKGERDELWRRYRDRLKE